MFSESITAGRCETKNVIRTHASVVMKSIFENDEISGKVTHGVGPGTSPGADGVVGMSGQKDAEPNVFC